MKALLLLAGQSRRFAPLREKPLFPLLGKTLAEHQVERLKEGGITDIILVTSPQNHDEISALFPDLPSVTQKDLSKGMQGACIDGLPLCNGEPVLVVGGNDVIDPQAYSDLLTAAKNADGAILAYTVSTYFPGGYLTLEGDRITGIKEKPGEGNEPSDLVNIVAHVHNDPEALLAILSRMESSTDDAYEQALQELFSSKTYTACRYEGPWYPVKFPWHLLPLTQYLLSELPAAPLHSEAQVHPSAVIEGVVHLGKDVRVLPYATIVGPCTIGEGTIIGNNALVRGSSIGAHCVIGYNTEVKGSTLADHVWTHSTYIGDSVVGRNVSFGAGSVTGNLRLDEAEITSLLQEQKFSTGLTKFGTVIGENCRLGIHTSINPGIKIGEGSFISSGVLLESDVPAKSFARMKDGTLHIKENTLQTPEPENRNSFKKSITKE